MGERRLYEVINPSDRITFRAMLEEAACIADIFDASMLFVKDIETGEKPQVEDIKAAHDLIYSTRAGLDSYADAFASFMVGTRSERELIEKAIERMSAEEAKAYRAEWHDKLRSSLNDICARCWPVADRLRAHTPEPLPSPC